MSVRIVLADDHALFRTGVKAELAGLGFASVIGYVPDVWSIKSVELIGAEVIPAVADL